MARAIPESPRGRAPRPERQPVRAASRPRTRSPAAGGRSGRRADLDIGRRRRYVNPMTDEHTSSQREAVGDAKGVANRVTPTDVDEGFAADEGLGLILYWASGLWIIVGLWAWIHPKSLQALLGPRYTIIYPERHAKARKAARKAITPRSE